MSYHFTTTRIAIIKQTSVSEGIGKLKLNGNAKYLIMDKVINIPQNTKSRTCRNSTSTNIPTGNKVSILKIYVLHVFTAAYSQWPECGMSFNIHGCTDR